MVVFGRFGVRFGSGRVRGSDWDVLWDYCIVGIYVFVGVLLGVLFIVFLSFTVSRRRGSRRL